MSNRGEQTVGALSIAVHMTSAVEVDMTEVLRLRDSNAEEFLARESVQLTAVPFLAKATVDALQRHQGLNASIDPLTGKTTNGDVCNLTIVDSTDALAAPVLRDAGTLSVSGLARRISALVQGTSDGVVRDSEPSVGTFTISGGRGVLFDTPAIRPQQVATLGYGAVVKRPMVMDHPTHGESIAVRQIMILTLSFDGQAIEGEEAARFLLDVKERLEGARFNV